MPTLTPFDLVVIGACIVLVLLPCKWDPAIWWKERQEKKRARRK